MKKLILILVIAGFTQRANAQWAVIDPSNLAQNISQVVKSSSQLKNMISNLEQTVKIYQQGKDYYDKLKSVSSIIKDARKVQLTVEMISEITGIYTTGFRRMLSDRNFSAAELASISDGYAILLRESGALVGELKNVVTPGNGLSMTDKNRMEMVDQIYTKMVNYRNLTRYFTDKNISISYLRSSAKNDAARVKSLYGKPSERYW